MSENQTTGPWQSADDIRTRFRIPNGSMTVLPEFRLTLPGGAVYRFDWHRYLGPIFVRTDGEPLARQPSARNPMWKAFAAWDRQGRKVDADGNCIWTQEPPAPEPVLRHIKGRHFEVIGWKDASDAG